MSVPAVVLDLSLNGISMARTLGRAGVPVIAFDSGSKVRLGRTRYADCRECPDPAVDEEGVVSLLIDEAVKLGERPVLYAGSDDFVLCVSRHRASLQPYYRFLLPDPDLVEALMDKRATHRLALEHGVPVPRTWMTDETDIEAVAEEAQFPCILKPAASYRFRRTINEKAFLVRTRSELKEKYRFLEKAGALMVQEWIPGADDAIYQIGFFIDEGGTLRARFAGRKLLQFPPTFGSGAVTVSESHPEVIALATRFVQRLNVVGLSNAEFKRDPRDGSFKLMEVDPRLWLWHDVARPAGVDLVSLYYHHLCGRPSAPILSQRDDIKWVYEVRAALAAWDEIRTRRLSVRRFMSYLRGERHYASFALDDPMPFLRLTHSHLRNRGKK